MKFLMVLGVGLFAAALTFAMNWLALIPWRRAKSRHWSEQARVYHPARVSAVSNLWVLPAVISITAALLFPNTGPHWALIAFAVSLGAILGTMPMDREVSPRIKLNELWRHIAINWVVRFLMWFIFLGSAVVMPQEFNAETIVILILFLALLIWWIQSGWLKILQALRVIAPPPERLASIVRNTSERMNVPVDQVFLMRTYQAQAYAMPDRRALLFSDRLLEILTDDEIAAISAHEIAHLTESRSDNYKRYVIWLVFTPWLLVKPMIHTLGFAGFYLLIATTVIVPRIFRHISRKLEERADTIAHANEPDSGTYARALTKLYEDNLLPAVNAKERATHPHLYDRLIAAGVTPDFPRPAPCATMSWNGVALSITLGVLAALLIFRITGYTSFH